MNNKLLAGALLIFLSMLALATLPGTAAAQCYLYRGADGQDVIGRIERGVVFKEKYNFTSVARVKDGVVYEGQYSYNVLGHFEGGALYKERFGDTKLGRVDDGYVYKDGEKKPVGRLEGCETDDDAAALAVALIFGLL